MSTMWKDEWEECSVIGDKGDIGFIDYEDDKSVYSYNPAEEEGPVVISVPFPFVKGKPQSVLVGDTISDTITIKNNTDEPVDLWSVKIYNSIPEDSYTLSLTEPPSADSDVEAIQGFLEASSLEDRMVQPGKTLKIWLVCKPTDIGLHTTAVHFDVGHDGQKTERVVFLLAEDKISRSLFSNKPYSRVQRKKHCVVTDYVVGSRPARQTTHGFKNRLPQFAIPIETRELLEAKQIPEILNDGLTKNNYSDFFSTLIIMEELHLEEDMRGHDMECVNMWRRGPNFLALEVPGLAERRPSLVYGDFIFAKLATSDPDDKIPPYQGYIHRVEADEVFLKFAKDLHLQHRDGDLYNVRFTYNRVNMRRLYQAVEAAENLEPELLFPSQFPKKRSIKPTPVVPLSPFVNEEQMFSVEMILGCKGSPPYVIHGPPGTGKTMTLVEAILQLYTTRKNARILVCAASNSAADHILERLISKEAVEIQDKEVFRLNATGRPYEDVGPDNIRFCYFEESVFKCPPFKALMRYKIIISTYMSASLLYGEGIKTGHFSHIFLDEAGQASEPETMTAISNLCRRETVVVLAGDPMQLGPVIFSKDAETWGLGKSYLARLFECEYYSSEDENYVTKLVRNYRCHPKILELPSDLFYNGELIACKEEKCSSSAAWKSLLPNKEFPVLFIGIQGCDEREGNNPSWFNRFEASKVVEIIKKITASSTLSEADIGVITPYRQQVLKLKKALETLDMPEVKVGSVEQFQGQEREVIIISTVRSTVKHNEFDKVHYLGFLSNPRRFNVAITRAKSLLVIIGNPHIISKDPYWEKLLWYCSDNNSYQGCPLPEKPDVTEEFQGQENNWEGEQENSQATEWTDGWTEEFPKTVDNESKWPGEWDEELPKTVDNEGKWPGEWDEELPKPVDNEGKWPGEWDEELPKPVVNEDKWSGEWNEELPKPVTSTGKWADKCDEKFPKPVTYEGEWSDECNGKFSKRVTNEVKSSNGWKEKSPRPVTNEDEWSDGWK